MKKSTFDQMVLNRLQAEDFAQPAKLSTLTLIWRKLCAVKIV